MNTPKITKQMLKELRGELLLKQSSQKKAAINYEYYETDALAAAQTDTADIAVIQEEENEMSM